jgi:general stress protein YciG
MELEMAGTKAGGQKAAATNKSKYGKDFYAEIGRKGGRNGHTGGFAANPELAKIAGAKGGRISKRGKAKIEN